MFDFGHLFLCFLFSFFTVFTFLRYLTNFEALEADITVVESLDLEEAAELSERERAELAALCGLYGTEPWQRLGLKEAGGERQTLIDRAEAQLDHWQTRVQPGALHRRLAEHGCRRLNQLLDYLEG